jgi:DNA replication protein DnaC
MPATRATVKKPATARDLAAEIVFLTRALKAPTLRESVERLAERARTESWSHEEFLVACLQREVSARESHGGEGRIRAARFPARKSLEEFDFDHARGLKRDVIAHLGTLDFVAGKENAVFLGPPGTGKTHLAIGLGMRACQGRAPGRVRHRRRVGRPPGRGPSRRPAPAGADQAGPLPAAGG